MNEDPKRMRDRNDRLTGRDDISRRTKDVLGSMRSMWLDDKSMRRMVSDFDRFSSGTISFDKIRVGPEMSPQQVPPSAREFSVRGCADPECAICNPETSAAIARGELRANDPSLRAAVENYTSRGDGRFSVAASPSGGTVGRASGRSVKSDPPDLVAAREAVKQWIVESPHQRFDDIVGNDEALAQLRDAIRAPAEQADLYRAYGMAMPKGALLSGPPGCGKTMFARAAASEMRALYGEGVELLSIAGGSLQSPYVGVTDQHIKAIFVYARLYAKHRGHPLLVFIDEAEVLFPDRTGRVRRLASWEESQVATFLAEMDGIVGSGAFVLLASNRPEVIDQAVLRDGRCDFKITIARPTPEAVEAILRRAFHAAPVAEIGGEEALVFAATESLLDPSRVIIDCHRIISSLEEWVKSKGATFDQPRLIELLRGRNFLLEHVVSGAMAASIPGRAKRYAFARDKASGVARGITVDDVVRSVGDIYNENRRLDHSFAFAEFQREIMDEFEAQP